MNKTKIHIDTFERLQNKKHYVVVLENSVVCLFPSKDIAKSDHQDTITNSLVEAQNFCNEMRNNYPHVNYEIYSLGFTLVPFKFEPGISTAEGAL